MNIDKLLVAHRLVVEKIVEYWITKYFKLNKEDVKDGIDWNWSNQDIGGIFYFADYYISFSTILECLNKNVEVEKYHDWYNYTVNNPNNYINLHSYLWGYLDIQQAELERSRKAVEDAKETLRLAIEEHNDRLKRI